MRRGRTRTLPKKRVLRTAEQGEGPVEMGRPLHQRIQSRDLAYHDYPTQSVKNMSLCEGLSIAHCSHLTAVACCSVARRSEGHDEKCNVVTLAKPRKRAPNNTESWVQKVEAPK